MGGVRVRGEVGGSGRSESEGIMLTFWSNCMDMML